MSTRSGHQAAFQHSYPFDPSYGFDLPALLARPEPQEVAGFAEFWRARYQQALAVKPLIKRQGQRSAGQYWQEDFALLLGSQQVGGWLLRPKSGVIRRALIVGHGYGGRESPDLDLPVEDALVLFLAHRGLSRSPMIGVSAEPNVHVCHGIDRPETYILGHCVHDLWCAATALLMEFPEVAGHLGYMGISFGGGLGAMALAWDQRFARAALNVPSFGDQRQRLTWPCIGSAHGLQQYQKRSHLTVTLPYYDAAVAAKYITQPMHLALALFDPVVAPPGQFAIHNALRGEKRLYVLEAGHFDYPNMDKQRHELRQQLTEFFSKL